MSIFKKQSRKYYKLDALWSELVRLKSNDRCEYCGKLKGQAHHIFGRRKLSTRWNESNGICLCPLHHSLGSQFSAHQTPTEFTLWVIKKRGQDWYDRLLLQSNTIGKPDLDLMELYLKRKIDRLKKERG